MNNKRIVAAIPAVLVLVIGTVYLMSRARSAANAVSVRSVAAGAESTRSDALRIGAYNIAHGRGPDPDASNWGGMTTTRRARLVRIGALLRELDLDVVVLNEVDFSAVWSGHVDQATLIAEAGGFPHVVRQRNIDVAVPFARLSFGNVILSRYPVTSVEFQRLPPHSRIEEWLIGSKHSVLARLALPDGSAVAIWAMHLEARDSEARVAAARYIADEAPQIAEPLFVVGDLNCSPTAEGGTALDILMASGLFDLMSTDGASTFPAHTPTRAIDWILAPAGSMPISARVVAVDHSDHRPVIATITLP